MGSRLKEKEVVVSTRKVFVPILVVDSTKEIFNKKKGNETADDYLKRLMKKK